MDRLSIATEITHIIFLVQREHPYIQPFEYSNEITAHECFDRWADRPEDNLWILLIGVDRSPVNSAYMNLNILKEFGMNTLSPFTPKTSPVVSKSVIEI